VMRGALADESPEVRRAALGILPTLPIPEATKVQQLGSVLTSGSVEDKQAAFSVLGSMKSGPAAQLLSSYVARLSELPVALRIDVVDAAQSNGSAVLQRRLESYRAARSAGTIGAALHEALLAGGNATRGAQIFAENPAAGCPRCHTIGTEGSDVGPNLTHIGAALPRELLLQALMEPNARIAPGFGLVHLTLRNGEAVDGTLRAESGSEIVLQSGTPPTERRVAKADVASRTDPVSPMPPFGQLLKLREIRDLVEYLSTLR
jgi:quinoprotein glucose dehydrogenase